MIRKEGVGTCCGATSPIPIIPMRSGHHGGGVHLLGKGKVKKEAFSVRVRTRVIAMETLTHGKSPWPWGMNFLLPTATGHLLLSVCQSVVGLTFDRCPVVGNKFVLTCDASHA